MADLSFVKIGDRICLYSAEGQGFLSSTGMNHPNFYVQKSGDCKLALVPNQRNMVFQLYPRLNYNVARDYDKMRSKLTGNASSIKNNKALYQQFLASLSVLQQRKESEMAHNGSYFETQRGEYIQYGTNIQLMLDASGQFLQLSKKSAEEDKTCQKLELTYSPVASRVTFQIQPRYKYRQEGDQVVFNDQIVLYNQKYNAYIHFSKDILQRPSPAFRFQSDFRPKSPLRRRNPETLFSWYEANVSQNYEKWTIQAFKHTDTPINEEFYLYGGDVVRIKHAESGGYLTVDDSRPEDPPEAYIRRQSEPESDDHTTYHQLFELEKATDQMEDSGSPLQWEEDVDGSQSVKVRLRHFVSGRLLQVCLSKDRNFISQILTLASNSKNGLEQDGQGLQAKKLLKESNRIQNYIFMLTNRATVDEMQLTRETVANISNQDTKTYISTDDKKLDDPEELDADAEEEDQIGDSGNLNDSKTIDNITVNVNPGSQSAAQESVRVAAKQDIEGASAGSAQQAQSSASYAKTYRPMKHDPSSDYIVESKIILRNRADMNDVFVPIKCSKEEIYCVLYVQASVPKIKQFLFYTREKKVELMNLPFFLGIQELLKGLVFFLVDEKDVLSDPMLLDGEPLKSRQKAMRECRYIDLLVDCLIYPFSSTLYKYEDLTQQHPITKICRLIYRLLKLSVKDNSMNKNYVAQWIDLFFTQAMICTDQNSFFAETAIHELIRDNPRLLEKQIDKVTIENLVKLCLQQPLHERFLQLLAGLCSCNNKAIQNNQDSVYETILEDEEIKRRLFFAITQEDDSDGARSFVHVRDDLNGDKIQKVAIEDLYNVYQEKGDLRLYSYFQALIQLSASICYMRNYISIRDLESVFTLDLVIDCVLNEKINAPLRASFANLLITLHLDSDPLEKLVLPVMTRRWDEIEQGSLATPVSTAEIHPKLLELKPAVNKFIRKTKGILIASQVEFNELMLEMLRVIETMIGLGFYNSNEELIEVTKPLLQILDGSFDFHNEEEMQQYERQVEETGDASIPLFRDEQSQKGRYKSTPENEVIMMIKDKIIDICKILLNFQNNTRLSLFLNEFGAFDKRGGTQINKYCQVYQQAIQQGNFKKFENQLRNLNDARDSICENVNEWVRIAYNERSLDLQTVSRAAGADFSCILLELNLYDSPKLVSNVFQLLIAQYSQKLSVFDLAAEVQILQEAEEIAILNACSATLRDMKKDAESCEFWLGKSDEESLKMSRSFIDRLNGLVDLCIYKENRVLDLQDEKKGSQQDEEFEFLNLSEFKDQWDDEDMQVCQPDTVVDEQNQRLLRNLQAHDSAMQIIQQKALKFAQNENAYLKVLEKAYTFLIMFVKKNTDNQNIVLEYIEDFLDDLDLGVHALELIKELFTDNQNLLEYPLVPLIRQLAMSIDSIEKESMKKATLLSFIPQFMCYRDEYQRGLQYLILSEFTSSARRNSNFLYVGEKGQQELAIQMEEMRDAYEQFMKNPSLVAEIEMPPEMCYTMMYIRLIAMSGMGKNVQCETRAQALLPMKDLAQNLDLADFCYPLKQSLVLFLEQIYLDTEKEIGEDFTNQMWRLMFSLEKDLLKFVEVMQKQRRHQGGVQRGKAAAGASATGSEAGDLKEMMMGGSFTNAFSHINVDVSKNFGFVTNFGNFKVSTLMTDYVFEGVFPCLVQFFGLRLPMAHDKKEPMRRLLKLCLMCISFKSKPAHEKTITQFVSEVRNSPVLQDLAAQLNMSLSNLGITGTGDEDEKLLRRGSFLSQAQKLKVFMSACRTDGTRKAQIAKEFEDLVLYIINIDSRTETAFKGANTIKNADFIRSLIISTDVSSSIPSELRTSSLTIIRKIIESENKSETGTNSSQWDTEDWDSYEEQIIERQTMLNDLGVVTLLCRVIAKESKRAILEEAFLVAIAVLLGGNSQSQQRFHEYIVNDTDNEFLQKVYNLKCECFEAIKKKAIKRNTKMGKIQILEMQLAELNEGDEEYQKISEQMKMDEELIKDTEYIDDEERVGETLTFSRALDNLQVILRFTQLLCENHNLELQKILCRQVDQNGKRKARQYNIVQNMARMFEQYQKIINSVTIQIGHGIVDAITECVQGPCKENQITLTQAKILDSSREFIANFDDKSQASALGFVPAEDEDEDDLIEVLDEFIQKIATMIVSLLEGEEDIDILQRMTFSLQIGDMKNRMLNVFGNFLIKLKLFPEAAMPKEGQDAVNLAKMSEKHNGEVLKSVSSNRIASRLQKDSFEGNISEAFEIYNLLQMLGDGLPAASQHLQRESFTPDQFKVFDFLRQHTGRIEVSVGGHLQRVYFPISPVCNMISRAVRKSVMLSIGRESQQQKVEGLMGVIPGLIDEMEQNYKLQNATIKITPKLMMDLKDFSTVVGAVISSIQLFFVTRVDHYRDRYVPDIVAKVITVLGLIQGVSSGLLVGFYIINRFNIVTKAKWRAFIKENKQKYKTLPNNDRLSVEEMSIEQTHLILVVNGPESNEFNIDKEKVNFGNFITRMEFRLINVYFFMQDRSFQYFVLYFGISVLGFISDELFYSLQLLDVVVRFPALTDVVKAVTLNANKLLSTGLLAMVIIYIFTTISFFYLQDTLYDYAVNAFDSDWVGENMCESMFQCYLTIIDKGLTLGGGIGDYTEAINYRDEPAKYVVKLAHDASFHILVKVILLNILFGIIIDTFAKMREQKKNLQMDTENVCFICNQNRFIFDKMCEGGFDRHVSKDHNLWCYVFYIVHLVSKDPTEMTGIESYVFDMYNAGDVSWLPRNNALVLTQLEDEEDQGEDELQVCIKELEDCIQKMDAFNARVASVTTLAAKQKKGN